MTATGIALAIFALLLFVPGVVQIVKRHRARRRLRATLLADLRIELNRERGERLRYEGLYRDKAREYAALVEIADPALVRAAGDALVDTPAYFDAVAWTQADDELVRRWLA